MIKLVSIADIISLINALFGFSALLMIYHNNVWYAFSFILLALLADGVDGTIARKTRKSELGEFLEAMADMISLGIAPAFFIYHSYYSFVSTYQAYHLLLIGCLIVFLSFSILRLASFHIIKKPSSFVGLPASASTIILLVLSFITIDIEFLLPGILLVSFAMISPVQFPKIDMKINSIAAVLIFLAILLGPVYHYSAPILLLIAILIYSCIGPLYVKKNSRVNGTKS
jgi:CDP-diacylglycerol--serine O-phosphatidyltransferase